MKQMLRAPDYKFTPDQVEHLVESFGCPREQFLRWADNYRNRGVSQTQKAAGSEVLNHTISIHACMILSLATCG